MASPLGYLRLSLISLFLLSIGASSVPAQQISPLGIPHIFGDHMVLQSGQHIPVWGWASPGESITVRFAGQKKQVSAAPGDGAWRVELDPLKASAHPRDLTVSGSETVIFHDVLVGEVWLCSGQSNMQKPLGTWRGQPITTVNYQQELAAANYPLIRLMNIKIYEPDAPARDIDTTQRANQDYPWAGWVPTAPASLDEVKFSAACYYFGRKVYQELHVPIGLVEASAGGSQIEAWTPPSGFASEPSLADFLQASKTPKVQYKGTRISTLYYGMIHPLVPYALRGVLWYQGESNVYHEDGPIYTDKMTALIDSWRAAWGRDLSFYFVQLPPLLYSVTRSTLVHSPEVEPVFWEAQTATLKLPNTGMIVTTDLGDPTNIHPPRKKEVGERLALWALAKDYGRKNIDPSGPFFRGLHVDGNEATLQFDHIGGGLTSIDGQSLTWFTVAGPDGKFVPAEARITGNQVVVSSPLVPHPTAVRFAWSEAATPNLFSKSGLPAVPFRSDHPLNNSGSIPPQTVP
jgi:sialate O-acetylesterase